MKNSPIRERSSRWCLPGNTGRMQDLLLPVFLAMAVSAPVCAHIHLEIRLAGRDLALTWYDFDTGDSDPASIWMPVPNAARQEVRGTLSSLLGPEFTSAWLLPQSETTHLPFLGIGAESIPRSALQNGSVTLRLESISGPGHFTVYQSSPFGAPQVWFHSLDGLPDTRVIQTGSGAHFHANWAFTAPGLCSATFAVEGNQPDGTPLHPARAQFHFLVEDSPAPTLSILPGPPLELMVQSVPGLPMRIDSSTSFGQWTPFHMATPPDGITRVPLTDLPDAGRYFRAVLP
jgi:surface-anchored protein